MPTHAPLHMQPAMQSFSLHCGPASYIGEPALDPCSHCMLIITERPSGGDSLTLPPENQQHSSLTDQF